MPPGVFTAQTVISSGYGLMQLMYSTTIWFNQWNYSLTEHRALGDHPRKLFDCDTSINFGCEFLTSRFFIATPRERNINCEYNKEDDWRSDWEAALVMYNGDPSYGGIVWNRSKHYLPPIPPVPSPAPANLNSQGGAILAKSGGVILSENNFKTKLIIPPNALPENAKVLIIKKLVPENQGMVFDLVAVSNQSGHIISKLNSPATIILYYNVVNDGYVANTNISSSEASDRLAIFYNDRVDWQKLQDHVDTTEQTVTAQIMNLGSYAIMPIVKVVGVSLNNVAPNPFTPNGDGINDEVFFYYDNPDNKSASIRIYALTGSLVKELEAVDGVIPSWDGKNSDGRLMEGGIYIYQLKIGNNVKSGTVILAK